jgi:hypothetical protein
MGANQQSAALSPHKVAAFSLVVIIVACFIQIGGAYILSEYSDIDISYSISQDGLITAREAARLAQLRVSPFGVSGISVHLDTFPLVGITHPTYSVMIYWWNGDLVDIFVDAETGKIMRLTSGIWTS